MHELRIASQIELAPCVLLSIAHIALQWIGSKEARVFYERYRERESDLSLGRNKPTTSDGAPITAFGHPLDRATKICCDTGETLSSPLSLGKTLRGLQSAPGHRAR